MAQPAKRFVPDVVVRFADGTSNELADFGLYSGHYTPNFYSPGSGRTRERMALALSPDIWREFSLEEVRELVAEPEGDDSKWLRAQVTLATGQTLQGRIPATVDPTWMGGDGFELVGSRSILGKEGEFAVAIAKVRKLTRAQGKPGMYTLLLQEGPAVTLRAPSFATYWTRPTRIVHKRLSKDDHEGIEVEVDKTTVILKRQDLAGITFNRGQTKAIVVETRKGDRADGTLKTWLSRAFGRMRSGEIWFGDLEKIASIRFLP